MTDLTAVDPTGVRDIDSAFLRSSLADALQDEASGQRAKHRLSNIQRWLAQEEDRHERGERVRLARYRALVLAERDLKKLVEYADEAAAWTFQVKRELIRRGEWP